MYQSELKQINMDFANNALVNYYPDDMWELLKGMNSELATIDELLYNGGISGIDHINHETQIYKGIDMLLLMLQYADGAKDKAEAEIDTPLKNNFDKNALKNICSIQVDSFTTANTLGLRKCNGVNYGKIDSTERTVLTISDFLGVNKSLGSDNGDVPPAFKKFQDQYAQMYNSMKADMFDEEGRQISLEEYLYALADRETPEHQVLSAVSNLLDIIFIKPLIESVYGKDLITGDTLTDAERGMKVVCGLIGVITLGTSGVLEMPFKEAVNSVGKLILVDAVSTQSSYMVSMACQELDFPLPLTIILSMAAGATVSYKVNGAVFEGVEVDPAYQAVLDSYADIESFGDFDYWAKEIGKRTDLTDAQKVKHLQDLLEYGSYKADVNVPSHVRYIKGFDVNGNVIYDWPPKLGFEPKSVNGITKENTLPDSWDRYGYIGGGNFADIPGERIYTYSERAIPYIENPSAYHAGIFNNDTYFDKIDAIKSGDIDGLNAILSKEGINNISIDDFDVICDRYEFNVNNFAKEYGNIDATYGLSGKAARWKKMEGGAGQFVTPINGNDMKVLGILKEVK